MEQEQVLQHFREAGALLEGHFLLSSGLHSPKYLQCALVLSDPRRAEVLCRTLADNIREKLGPDGVDLVVGPAMGGVVVAYELARQLGVRGIFAERVDGDFALRRGFSIPKGARVVIAEDIVTTGLSSRECLNCIEDNGGKVVAVSCFVDRSAGKADFGVPLVSLTELDIPTYEPSALPEELAKIPAIKPGSRGIK